MVTLALLFSCFVQFPCDKCLSWSALKSVEGYWRSCQSTQCNDFFLRPYTFSIQHFQIDSVQLHLSSLNKVLAGTSNLSHCTMIPEFEASLDWFFLDVLFHWRATFEFYHALVNTLQFIIESSIWKSVIEMDDHFLEMPLNLCLVMVFLTPSCSVNFPHSQ